MDVSLVVYNLRFPGQYYDQETGLNYNYARDYDSSTGRYVESDPLGLVGGMNSYAYARGNPLSYGDPLGLYPAIVVTLPNGTSYAPLSIVKNGDQSASSGYNLAIGTPVPIAVPAGVNPQGIVDATANPILGLPGIVFDYRPGGPLDFKKTNPMYDALGNFLFGAAGAKHGASCSTMTMIGDQAHAVGVNNPINTGDIQSGFNALSGGGTLSVVDTNSPGFSAYLQ